MSEKESEFLKRLLATFKVEAAEHINALSSGLVELEQEATAERQMGIIEAIFREAHSLKGAARSVNLTGIETFCQALESVFAALKRQDMTLSPALFDVLHEAVDTLDQLLPAPESEWTAEERARSRGILHRLEGVSKGASRPQPPALKEPEAEAVSLAPESEVFQLAKEATGPRTMAEEKPRATETIRIATAKLDSILLQAEELLSAKLVASQRAIEVREVNALLAVWEKEWAKVRPEVRTVEQSFVRSGNGHGRENGQGKKQAQIQKLLEFLEWNRHFVISLEDQLAALEKSVADDQRSLGGMVDHLLWDMKQVLMLPFSSLLESFPKLLRDLARDQGKRVELVMQGTEIEIDRRILEEMKDPLIHLVRNAIDHGIEKPEERERQGKPPRGTVTVTISQQDGGKVEVLVSDDGAGIDAAKVRAAALKVGVVSPEETEKLGEPEMMSLIFESGVSTNPIITDLSGRGLGLAIVREKVEKLGGAVSLETRPDAGTTYRLLLPLALATFRGILVRVAEHLLVLPTAHVERVVRVNSEEIKTVENRETIELNGQPVSLVRLAEVLEIPRKPALREATDKPLAVVLGAAEKRIAFLVDEVLGEQEVLVKRLGQQLSRVRNVAGATVLGNGKVAPVLNVSDVLKSAVHASAPSGVTAAVSEEEEGARKSVLVVEDSITARTLVKNILEAAGYDVKTAVDGVDGFTQLRAGEFALVVSDVEMPRMNGFDLTAKIRSDRRLQELPVVLVTALGSREDRERGIDVGANAYIVKSSFDQSNLLEAIRRLI